MGIVGMRVLAQCRREGNEYQSVQRDRDSSRRNIFLVAWLSLNVDSTLHCQEAEVIYWHRMGRRTMKKIITYGHLFSGINAPEYAAMKLGLPMQCLFTSEIDEAAIAVQRKNFPSIPCLGDISTVVDSSPPKVDLIVAGSSCQSFSVNGDRTNLDGESGIVRELWRYLAVHQPRAFIWENVASVTRKSSHETLQQIVDGFTGGIEDASYRLLKDGSGFSSASCSGGYHIAWVVLNAKDYSPQNRERVYMVGFKDLSCFDIYRQLIKSKQHSLPTFLKDDGLGLNKVLTYAPETDFTTYLEESADPEFLSAKALNKIYEKNEATANIYKRILAWAAKDMAATPDLKTPVQPYTNFVDYNFKAVFEETTRRLGSSDNYKLPRQRLITPCLTVGDSGYTGKGRGGSKKLALFYVDNEGYFRCRRITTTETEKLQGFPSDWTAVDGLSDGKRRRLVGNSMSVACIGVAMKAVTKLWEQF